MNEMAQSGRVFIGRDEWRALFGRADSDRAGSTAQIRLREAN